MPVETCPYCNARINTDFGQCMCRANIPDDGRHRATGGEVFCPFPDCEFVAGHKGAHQLNPAGWHDAQDEAAAREDGLADAIVPDSELDRLHERNRQALEELKRQVKDLEQAMERAKRLNDERTLLIQKIGAMQ
jgi:hypothetical protein